MMALATGCFKRLQGGPRIQLLSVVSEVLTSNLFEWPFERGTGVITLFYRGYNL